MKSRPALVALLLLPAAAAAQFVATKEPSHTGVRATADLPAGQHMRNTGGSDGFGLCVPTSAVVASRWQDVRELFDLRAYTERRPGGSYPAKFRKTLEDYCREKQVPVPAYLQHEGGDAAVLELALRTGRMPSVTYCGVDGPGRYGNEVIAHMVNLVHLDDTRAAIVDNNFPGTWLWMGRNQFLSRHKGVQEDGRPFLARDKFGRPSPVGGGWSIVFLASPPAPYPAAPVAFGAGPPCVCGDSCACGPGVCPNKCPVSYGQCRNGRCQTAPAVPPAPPAPEAPSRWMEWRRFADGTEGWAVKDVPPAARPAEAAPAADPFPGGVDSGKLADKSAYWLNGRAVTKAEAIEAMQLTDDTDRWNLSVVGDGLFQARVRKDVEGLPTGVRTRLHVQTYAPEGWQAAQFRLRPGVTLREPDGKDGDRRSRTVAHVPEANYGPDVLASLMSLPGGPDPRPAPAPQPQPKPKDEPAPPKVDPAPRPPQPVPVPPAPRPAPEPSWLALILSAVLAWLFARR